MVQIVAKFCDISRQLAAGAEPAVVVKRNGGPDAEKIFAAAAPSDGATWQVLRARIDTADRPQAWSQDTGGEYVRVPMLEYRLQEQSPETLLRFGLQIGAAAAVLAGEASQLLLLLGNVFRRPDDKAGFQVWLGIAVKSFA